MSKLVTFFKNFWEGVKKAFSNMDETKQSAIKIAVQAVEVLKTVLNHPGVDLLTKAIPGDKDDKLVKIGREALPKILVWLKLAESYHLPDPNNLLTYAQQKLAEVEAESKDAANAFKKEIATLLARELSNKEITFGDTGAAVENYYKTEIKKTA